MTKLLTLTIEQASVSDALALTISLLDDYDGLNVVNVNITESHFGCSLPTAQEAPDETEETKPNPHHIDSLDNIELPSDTRSSEVNPGDNPVLTADPDVINECFSVCSQQRRAVEDLNKSETEEAMLEVNGKYPDSFATFSVDLINNVDYYREVTQALHRVELRASGYGNDTVNQRLKAENPKIAALLRM